MKFAKSNVIVNLSVLLCKRYKIPLLLIFKLYYLFINSKFNINCIAKIFLLIGFNEDY